MKPHVIIVGIVVLILVLPVLIAALKGEVGARGLTREKFDQIQVGMTYEQVVEILGPGGEDLTSANTPPNENVYLWRSSKGAVRINTRDDKVIGMKQGGL